MTIDSHQHFWKYDPARDAWITDQMSVLRRDFLPDDLTPECTKNGIDATIAVQADQSESETLFLLDLAAKHANIAGVVGWVDLCSPEVAERLSFFSNCDKLVGFRHVAQSEPDDRFLVGDAFVNGVACLGRFGFAYDILIFPKQLPAALELVAKFPAQRFVIDHMAKPAVKTRDSALWTERICAVAQNPNVFCKLSGLVTEADWERWKAEDFTPYLDVVFEAFGAERLMFGSDWPVCLLAANYGQVKEIVENYLRARPTREKEMIFGGNAARFYKLKANQHGLAA